jgi:hypothetical protein
VDEKMKSRMREKLGSVFGTVFDTLLVLSFQVVFRAMHEARRWNY